MKTVSASHGKSAGGFEIPRQQFVYAVFGVTSGDDRKG